MKVIDKIKKWWHDAWYMPVYAEPKKSSTYSRFTKWVTIHLKSGEVLEYKDCRVEADSYRFALHEFKDKDIEGFSIILHWDNIAYIEHMRDIEKEKEYERDFLRQTMDLKEVRVDGN